MPAASRNASSVWAMAVTRNPEMASCTLATRSTPGSSRMIPAETTRDGATGTPTQNRTTAIAVASAPPQRF
jgi:hypothetical protein